MMWFLDLVDVIKNLSPQILLAGTNRLWKQYILILNFQNELRDTFKIDNRKLDEKQILSPSLIFEQEFRHMKKISCHSYKNKQRLTNLTKILCISKKKSRFQIKF